MSGIVGILRLDGVPVEPRLLRQLTDSIAFRGPDAQEVWLDGAIGFGHTMLRTTWEAEYEQQPFSLDRQVWIVADARIDGRVDLIEKLGIRNQVQLDRLTDVELILRAYLTWGDRCVDHLIGDFAFAIWDNRHKRLFCARDQFGIKLFYYSRVGNCLIISNTLNCIRQHPQVSSELNEQAIGDFLLFGMNYNLETTTFVDIQRLPAAHTLTWSLEKGLRTQRYWTLPLPDLIRYKRSQDYIDHFKELMGQAVGDRLRTEKVGIYLSGGLDSTTIAATAVDWAKKQAKSLDLQAFTVVYDEIMPDEERHYSGLAANALGIPIHYQTGDHYYPYQGCNCPTFHTPEPSHEPLYAIGFDLRKQAASHSRVVFSGDGGDEALKHSTVRELLKVEPFIGVLLDVGRCWLRYGIQPIWGSGVLASLRGWQKPNFEDLYPTWLNLEFAQRCGLRERWQEIIDSQAVVDHSRSTAYNRLTTALWSNKFEQNDPGFSRVLTETRFPFLDLRLLQYLLALPVLPWCVNKSLVRMVMRNILPDAVRLRPKAPLAGDLYSVKKLQNDYLETSWKMWDEVEKYVNINQLIENNTQFSDYKGQSLSPISLAYWLDKDKNSALLKSTLLHV